MTMDHGVLNIPLAKRGDIDKQLDAYKREKARTREAQAKASRAEFKAQCDNAKRILAAIVEAPDLLEQQAAKRGMKRGQLLALLKGVASTKPAHMVAFERDWLAA
ncbi:hypothetical protein [Ralstonia mannitolilytica]|uniref:hypothetical protein n=1 Tax=Ralstonia mannitolilytica TaxID=105219 RepID=UPI0039B37572